MRAVLSHGVLEPVGKYCAADPPGRAGKNAALQQLEESSISLLAREFGAAGPTACAREKWVNTENRLCDRRAGASS